MNILSGFFSFINRYFDKRNLDVFKWKVINGDGTLNINYPLDKNSIVLDVGGYGGNWTKAIYSRYHCNVYTFEPVLDYVKKMKSRFRGVKKIHILPYGLACKTSHINLYMNGDRTSEFGSSNECIKVTLRNVKMVLNELKIKKIDLVSINIEGGEYELLDYLISSGLITRFANIQIQFHTFVNNSKLHRKNIQLNLSKTHKQTYDFPFVWESWTIKK